MKEGYFLYDNDRCELDSSWQQREIVLKPGSLNTRLLPKINHVQRQLQFADKILTSQKTNEIDSFLRWSKIRNPYNYSIKKVNFETLSIEEFSLKKFNDRLHELNTMVSILNDRVKRIQAIKDKIQEEQW